jgi:hypothetical protein
VQVEKIQITQQLASDRNKMHDKIQTLQMEKSVLITAQNENVKIKEKVKNLEKKVNDYNES